MDKILKQIRKLEEEGDADKLSSYLIQLAKYGEQPLQYEEEYRKYFNSEDWVLRKVAVFCLLFALQIDKPEYRHKAIHFVSNKEEDFDVRIWAAAGLAQTYQQTKDEELLNLFIELLADKDENEFLKDTLLSSALLVYGLSFRDQSLRASNESKFREKLTIFEKEIIDIKELTKR